MSLKTSPNLNLGTVAGPLQLIDGEFTMTFTNGGTCRGGTISSTIIFVCDPTGMDKVISFLNGQKRLFLSFRDRARLVVAELMFDKHLVAVFSMKFNYSFSLQLHISVSLTTCLLR